MDELMYLMLNSKDLHRLSDGARQEIFDLLAQAPRHDRRHGRGIRGKGPAELTLEQAEAYVADVSEKTRALLKALVEAPETGTTFRALAAATPGVDSADDLRTLWSGLKKRTSTITGDPMAYLVERTRDAETGDRGARLNPETRRVLRAIFGLEVDT